MSRTEWQVSSHDDTCVTKWQRVCELDTRRWAYKGNWRECVRVDLSRVVSNNGWWWVGVNLWVLVLVDEIRRQLCGSTALHGLSRGGCARDCVCLSASKAPQVCEKVYVWTWRMVADKCDWVDVRWCECDFDYLIVSTAVFDDLLVPVVLWWKRECANAPGSEHVGVHPSCFRHSIFVIASVHASHVWLVLLLVNSGEPLLFGSLLSVATMISCVCLLRQKPTWTRGVVAPSVK